jgi:hypothetical protein
MRISNRLSLHKTDIGTENIFVLHDKQRKVSVTALTNEMVERSKKSGKWEYAECL